VAVDWASVTAPPDARVGRHHRPHPFFDGQESSSRGVGTLDLAPGLAHPDPPRRVGETGSLRRRRGQPIACSGRPDRTPVPESSNLNVMTTAHCAESFTDRAGKRHQVDAWRCSTSRAGSPNRSRRWKPSRPLPIWCRQRRRSSGTAASVDRSWRWSAPSCTGHGSRRKTGPSPEKVADQTPTKSLPGAEFGRDTFAKPQVNG